jgi:hypothetical protein
MSLLLLLLLLPLLQLFAVGKLLAVAAVALPIIASYSWLLFVLLLLLLQLFAAPAVGKLLAVAAVALPIIAVGGLAYRKAVGDPDCSWQEALGRTYCVLNNCPGVL